MIMKIGSRFRFEGKYPESNFLKFPIRIRTSLTGQAVREPPSHFPGDCGVQNFTGSKINSKTAMCKIRNLPGQIRSEEKRYEMRDKVKISQPHSMQRINRGTQFCDVIAR